MHLDVTQWATLSTLGIVLSSWIFIALERRFPYDRGQPLFRRGWFVDFFWYTLVQSALLGAVIGWIIQWLDARAAGRLHLVGSWPFWAQALFFLVTHDFYIYNFHKLQHKVPLLWRTHEAHHSVKDVDWLAGSRSHVLEILINQTIEYAPIVLLGAPPEMAVLKSFVDAVWGMYIHSNIDVRAGRLQLLINGPQMHRWHHSTLYFGDGMNYSTKLAIWDWIFGTAYLPKEKPPGYGLTDVDFPEAPFTELRVDWAERRTRPLRLGRVLRLVARDVLWQQLRLYLVQQLFAFRRFAAAKPEPAADVQPLTASDTLRATE
ncbi:MAG TPA: sterol desaturase family protein [Minicystis sp.]|nr:sterol desaturase family protein [Minicystis sp.]